MSRSDIERRQAAELRASGRKLVGYVAKFGSETRVGSFRETIARGAFTASLASGADILALADHDPAAVLGRTRSGTLTLREDADGLAFELTLPDTQKGRDLAALAERGDLGGMSFGFRVHDGGDTWNGDLRELRNVELREISVVQSWPAYGETEVSVRSRQPESQLALLHYWLETVR